MNWKKVGIGCGVGCGLLVMLLVCGGVAAKFWWASSGHKMMEGLNAAGTEAETFAKTHDAPACVDEAMTRAEPCQGASSLCAIHASTFLYSCLLHAKRPPDFCSGVPKTAESAKDIDAEDAWRTKACEKLGHPGETCEQMLMQEQLACEQPARE